MSDRPMLFFENGGYVLRQSADLTIDFASVKVGGSGLEITESAGHFDFGAKRLTNVADPQSAQDVATKAYVDLKALVGGIVKEPLLVEEQLNDSQGILAAMGLRIVANLTEDDTIVITDGSNSETYTFKNAGSEAFEVTIGADEAETMDNLVTTITDDSLYWGAVHWADRFVVIYEKTTDEGPSTSRVYGTLDGGQEDVQVFAYNNLSYYSTSVVGANLPSADPAAGRFGFRREASALTNGEIHLALATDVLLEWNEEGASWYPLTSPSTPEATSGSGGGVKGRVTFDSDKGLSVTAGVAEVKVDGLTIGFDEGGSLAVPNSGIGTTQLADDAVDKDKIASDVAGYGLRQNADGSIERNDAVSRTNDNAGTISARQVVYVKTDGDVDLARADVSNIYHRKLGIVEDTTIATTATGKIVERSGAMIGGFSDLEPGTSYYLVAGEGTAGAITSTPPSAPGEAVYLVGKAVSATVLEFTPRPLVEIAA